MVGDKLYQQLANRHGHYCPMSTLGVRLAETAHEQMALRPAQDWKLCYLARTCAVDGIRIVIEQIQPGVDLRVEQKGQHRLQCRSDVAQVSLQLTEQAMQLAASYRDLPEEQKLAQLELLRTTPAAQLITISEG